MKKVLNYEVVSVTNYNGRKPVSVTTIFYNRRDAIKQYGLGVKYYSSRTSLKSYCGDIVSVHLFLRKNFNEIENEIIMQQVFNY